MVQGWDVEREGTSFRLRTKGQEKCWDGERGWDGIRKRKNVSAIVRNVIKSDFRVNSQSNSSVFYGGINNHCQHEWLFKQKCILSFNTLHLYPLVTQLMRNNSRVKMKAEFLSSHIYILPLLVSICGIIHLCTIKCNILLLLLQIIP